MRLYTAVRFIPLKSGEKNRQCEYSSRFHWKEKLAYIHIWVSLSVASSKDSEGQHVLNGRQKKKQIKPEAAAQCSL